MKQNIVTYESIGNTVKIFINGIMHIGFKADELKGMQAWRMGRVHNKYCIELHFVSDGANWTMDLEYDNKELSQLINKQLEDFI